MPQPPEPQQLIADALRQLEEEKKLPMQSGRLARELARNTSLSLSTMYRYQRLWRRYTYSTQTSLDIHLTRANPQRRFLIGIRVPADLLFWVKAQADRRHMRYQSFLIAYMQWASQNPLMADPDLGIDQLGSADEQD